MVKAGGWNMPMVNGPWQPLNQRLTRLTGESRAIGQYDHPLAPALPRPGPPTRPAGEEMPRPGAR